MKKLFLLLFIFPLLTIAQVGVNTTTPNAMLDIQSANNGILIPRVQLIDALDIVTVVNPTGGILTKSTLVYNINPAGIAPNTVTDGFYYWNGARWIALSDSENWSLNGNSGILQPANPITYGTSTIAATENFIGTTDNNDVTIATNNIERIRVKNTSGNVGIGTANPTSTLEIAGNGTAELKLSSRSAFGPTRFSMISDKELLDEWRPSFIESADNGGFTGRMDFFTNGTGIANKFGSLRTMSITNGKVGIGTTNPSEKIHVFDSSDANKSSIFSETRQITAGTHYDNTAIKGYGRALPFWGFGNGVMGIGDVANSYFATGVYAHLGSTSPTLPSSNQALYVNGNGLGFSGIFTGGNVGIGEANPSRLFHVNSTTNGAVRIVDGTQALNRVLTSDANGVATWQSVGIDNIQANLAAVTGITISYTDTADFLQTGASITLPPGRYAVNVTMLLSTVPGAYTNSNEAFWVRSSFSDSAGPLPFPSGDIIGSNLVSGNLVPSTLYSLITGMVVINNSSVGNKTYHYIAGRVVTNNSTRSIAFFGGNYWAEDNIIAYRLN